MTISCDPLYGRPMQLFRRDRYGNDIDVLDILGSECGDQGVTLMEGYKGFYHAQRKNNREQSAYGEGSIPSPFSRVEERGIEFILGTQAESPAAWERIETRLWKFLSTDFDCWIRVYSELSEPRELRIRLDRMPEDLLMLGPGLMRFGVWKCIAYAWDPWWYSETLKSSIKRSQMLQVSTGVWEGTVPIRNEADQKCWLQFSSNELTATTTVSVPDHLTGRMVTLPPLGVGKSFLVQTHPLAETLMVMDDSLEWANMNARAFGEEPLPAGMVQPVQVPIRIVGGTADTEIAVYMLQKWDRMFGGESDEVLVGAAGTSSGGYPSPDLLPGNATLPQPGGQ